MPCHYCGRGLHRECLTRCKTCHPSPKNPKNIVSALKPSSTGLVGRPLKELDAMKDVKSTGRKRAALLYPLDKNHPCEWRGKKNCGGGLKPIVGCLDGFQRHRHHGPIKNPVHNEQGNVHRICATCHNRWHALNDPIYNEQEYMKLPHSPEDATEDEIRAADAWWKLPEARKALQDVKHE